MIVSVGNNGSTMGVDARRPLIARVKAQTLEEESKGPIPGHMHSFVAEK